MGSEVRRDPVGPASGKVVTVLGTVIVVTGTVGGVVTGDTIGSVTDAVKGRSTEDSPTEMP